MELELARTAGGIAHVQADDTIDAGARVQQREQPLSEKAGDAGDRDHPLPAVVDVDHAP